MKKAKLVVYVLGSAFTAFSTVLLTSTEFFDGILRREKVTLEIQKLRADLSNYEKVVGLNLEKIQSETELNYKNLQVLSESLRPQIDKLEIETQVMRRELNFNSLANDLALIRDLRPIVNVNGNRQKTFGSGNIDVLLEVKNTGNEVVQIGKFSSHFNCDGKERNNKDFYQHWSVASGDTFIFDPPEMPLQKACGMCQLIFTFVASADPVAIRLLEARYAEVIDEFSEFLEAKYTYRFSC